MIVGVPSETKTDEYRVAITPAGVRELCSRGHEVLIQAGAGLGSAIDDLAYQAQGARIVPDAATVFAQSQLVLKVNGGLQGVPLTGSGISHVSFRYRPTGLRLAIGVSLGAASAALICLFAGMAGKLVRAGPRPAPSRM